MAGDDINVDVALEAARKFPGLKGMDLAKEVTSTREVATSWTEGQLDLDSQRVRQRRPAVSTWWRTTSAPSSTSCACWPSAAADVTVVPAQTPAADVLALKPDGVFLSNGPGDPEPCDYAIAAIKVFIAKKLPVFGICLGHQLLASGLRREDA
jgi:carbamoyl-phosphate synthase small subunit